MNTIPKISPSKQIMCIICHKRLTINTEKHVCTTRTSGQDLIVQSVQIK
jgi:hypothetical protein